MNIKAQFLEEIGNLAVQNFTLDTFIKIFNYVYINKTFAL